MNTPICSVDFDEATYIGNEEDGVYYQTAQTPTGDWYMSADVDCNSGHFTQPLVTDDGPYATEAEADTAGRNAAIEWCITNGVDWEEEADDDA